MKMTKQVKYLYKKENNQIRFMEHMYLYHQGVQTHDWNASLTSDKQNEQYLAEKAQFCSCALLAFPITCFALMAPLQGKQMH